MKILNYRILIEQDEDGVFVASIPSMQGCYTEGDTYEEAMKNIQDVIKLHIQLRKDINPLPDDSNTEFVGIKNITIPYVISAHN